jgi:hypothetical protein
VFLRLENNHLVIKSRKGHNQNNRLACDIYYLSIFYLDNNYTEIIDDTYSVVTKPSVAVNEKNKIKSLVESVYIRMTGTESNTAKVVKNQL